jgi:hypothetical protein
LTQQLTGLVKQMMSAVASNPAQKTTLAQLATTAQASLKQGNLQQAAAGIASLQQALAGGSGASSGPSSGNGAAPLDGAAATPVLPAPPLPASPPPASPPPASPPPPTAGAAPATAPQSNGAAVKPSDTPAGKVHAKAGVAWKATHTKMTGDLDQLTSKFTAAFKDHAQADELQKAFKAKIDGVLGQLDQSLSAKLGELNEAKDAAAHSKIITEAKAIMSKYQQVVASDPTIAAIDKNPFAPIGLQKTLTTTLSTLAKVLT